MTQNIFKKEQKESVGCFGLGVSYQWRAGSSPFQLSFFLNIGMDFGDGPVTWKSKEEVWAEEVASYMILNRGSAAFSCGWSPSRGSTVLVIAVPYIYIYIYIYNPRYSVFHLCYDEGFCVIDHLYTSHLYSLLSFISSQLSQKNG